VSWVGYDSLAMEAADPPASRALHTLVAHCHVGLGTRYHGTGQRAQSDGHFTTAMYREMDMGFWLGQAEADRDI